MSKLYLSVAEVAEELCVSTGTIYAMIADRELPSLLVRHCIRIRRTDLDAYLESQYRDCFPSNPPPTAEGSPAGDSPGATGEGTSTPPPLPSAP